LVAAFDEKAQVLWRHAPVVHVGGLAVSGAADKILAACFSEGICWLDGAGALQKYLPTPGPCSLVSQSFTGDVILAGGFGKLAIVMNGIGEVIGQHELASTIQALALGPLANEFYAPLADGVVVKHRLDLSAGK